VAYKKSCISNPKILLWETFGGSGPTGVISRKLDQLNKNQK